MRGRLRQRIEQLYFLREIGERSALPSVLWIHGLGESGLSFESVAQHELLADYHHLIPDLPGYGRSLWREPAPSLTELVDGLALWLEIRGEGPIVVVGHSLGGVLGLLLAERHPERLRALVNVEGNLTFEECVYSGPAAASSLGQFLAGGFEAIRDWAYRRGVESEAHRGYYASLRLADPWAFHAHAVELVEMSRRGDLASRQAALALPHVYVGGVPGGVSEGGLQLLRDHEVPVVCVQEAGHWPFLDHEARFGQILAEFLGWESPVARVAP